MYIYIYTRFSPRSSAGVATLILSPLQLLQFYYRSMWIYGSLFCSLSCCCKVAYIHISLRSWLLSGKKNQKNPRVRKICVRNSGAGNGCANFMDTWKKCVLSAGKTSMSIKFLVSGGGGNLVLGGGECRFYFYGRGDFSEKNSKNINFLVRISRGHSRPLRPDAQGSKSFSPPPGPQENTLFGADVHDFLRGRP